MRTFKKWGIPVHPYNGILFNYEKELEYRYILQYEWTLETC